MYDRAGRDTDFLRLSGSSDSPTRGRAIGLSPGVWNRLDEAVREPARCLQPQVAETRAVPGASVAAPRAGKGLRMWSDFGAVGHLPSKAPQPFERGISEVRLEEGSRGARYARDSDALLAS